MDKIGVFGSELCHAGIEWFQYNFPFSKRRLAVLEWYQYRMFFSKEAVLVSGLVFGHSFVEHAVVSVMITFITENLPKKDLRKAAAIVNLQEGVTPFMALAISHISDAFSGRLNMLAITNVFYIIGLVLLLLSDVGKSNPSTMIFLISGIVLIALGKAAEEPILKEFLSDQLCEQEKNPKVDEERANARSRVWWRASWFLGATAALICGGASPAVMLISYLFFLCGVRSYYRKKSEGSLLTSIYRVSEAAILKWFDPRAATQYYSPEEEERKGKLCTVEQEEEVKCLLNTVPMWLTFLVYSLVEATASTFFIEQTSNLNRFIGNSYKVPIVSLIILQSCTSSIISSLFELLIPPSRTEAGRKVATRVRIVVGMVCSMFSCIAAYLVESHRLDLIRKQELINDEITTIDMSIFWLVPQFFLCGVMEGLARDGLDEFLTDQFGESLGRQGQSINECVLGTGKFITILCVFLFRDWFSGTINGSHLDKYYILLAGLSFVNLPICCAVFYFYYDSRRRLRRGGSRCNLGRQNYEFNYVEAQGEERGSRVWSRHNKFRKSYRRLAYEFP